MLVDLSIVFLLLLLNGFFAMSELAIVSARRARLRAMAEEGGKKKAAAKALEMAQDPSSFLSIVQIGVTLNSILAGAFSGATLAEPLGEILDANPYIVPHGQSLAMGLTVIGVSYFSLVIGELVPKRIGLAYAETIAVHVAGIMNFLALVAAPIVWILRQSTEIVLKLIGFRGASNAAVTEEEVRDMIAEGTQTGVFKPAEKDMIEGVMRLADRSVRSIMTPRIDMAWLGVEDTNEENLKTILESGHSRFPVARGDMEAVLGMVLAKDLLNTLVQKRSLDMTKLMHKPLVVPDTTPVLRLLDEFRRTRQHAAIIIDEYGSVEGMVTITDVLETILGDMPEAGRPAGEAPVKRDDGGWLIDGMQPIDEVEALLGLKNMREGGDFHTLAGFVVDKLGRIPATGDHFVWHDTRFEVVDMDGRRVDKVLLMSNLFEDNEID